MLWLRVHANLFSVLIYLLIYLVRLGRAFNGWVATILLFSVCLVRNGVIMNSDDGLAVKSRVCSALRVTFEVSKHNMRRTTLFVNMPIIIFVVLFNNCLENGAFAYFL